MSINAAEMKSKSITEIPFDEYKYLSDEELSARTAVAKSSLGERMLVLGHHYQRDQIIQFADLRGDSFKLSQQAAESSAEYIMFCGVHFMAESANILTSDEQKVILPDLSAGCSMADMANLDQVETCWDKLHESISEGSITPVTYMNSAADLKAFCGENDGIVCTSTNAAAVLEWALKRKEKVLFFPDQHLGRNTAKAMGISLDEMTVWDPYETNGGNTRTDIQRAKIILWKGHCSVHTIFQPEHLKLMRAKYPGIQIIVHPECTMEVVDMADYSGSTGKIIKKVTESPSGSKWAVGTEIHLVERLNTELHDREVYFLSPTVCLCSTMYRIDPKRLCWAMENTAQGTLVNRITVPDDIQYWSKIALERMLAVI